MYDAIGGDGGTQHLTNIGDQPGPRRQARRHDRLHAYVPRQFPIVVGSPGGYDHVAEALVQRTAVDGFFLEYDDARSGGFAPLRFVPRRKKRVVLGLVTRKRAASKARTN